MARLILHLLATLSLLLLPGAPRAARADPPGQATKTFTGTVSLVPSASWSATGSLATARYYHTAVVLPSGKVLVAGGNAGNSYTASAELYDPATGTWSATGSLATARGEHTAVTLANGKVLVAGGGTSSGLTASAELYDPATGTWSTTGSLGTRRRFHTAVVLAGGGVLVAGGESSSASTSAELYDPPTGAWSATGSLATGRAYHTAVVLPNGKVLVVGGWAGSDAIASAELYDPVTRTWSSAGRLANGRWNHTAVVLPNGKVLVAGGGAGSGAIASAELFDVLPANTFSATLTLPSGWLTSSAASVTISGTTSAAALNAAALSNDSVTWGSWISATNGVPITVTWNLGADGANKPVYLRLRDTNDLAATIVTGTVSVDATPPIAVMSSLPATSPSAIALAWSGSDVTSGIASYDLQVRDGAGNVSDPVTGTIRLDTAAGTSRLVSVDGGALWTNATGVTLTVGAPEGTAEMQLSNDGGFAGATWQPFESRPNWTIVPDGSYVVPRTVYVRVRDLAGNPTDAYTDDILYDPVPPTGTITATLQSALTVRNAAAAAPSVLQVGISASDPDNLSGVPAMRVGLDPTLAQTLWETYQTSKTVPGTNLSSSTVVYAQFRDGAGNVSRTVCARPDGGTCYVLPYRVSLPLAIAAFSGGW